MNTRTAPESQLTRADLVALIHKHQAGVWRYLRALGCDPAQADDFTQDTFLAMFQREFQELSDSATAAYLRKIAYSLVVSAKRRSSRVVSVENMDEFEEVWTRWVGDDQGDELLDRLRTCLTGLTDRARMALQMRYRDKSTRLTIADALGISEHGAKNLMQRAKKQLRECIESKLDDQR